VLGHHLKDFHGLDLEYNVLLSDPGSKKKENYKVG